MTIDWVFLDVGGIIFSDDSYFTGLYESIARAEPRTTRAAYDTRLKELRARQSEPFTTALLDTFAPDPAGHAAIRAAADESWAERGHLPDELYPEAIEALRALAGRYKLACITNHFSWVRERAEVAGFGDLVSVWAISAEVGAEKPNAAIFESALRGSGATPDRVAMVGDRLDRDIAPAKALGMRTVWVLRNEAPDDPTPEQLAVPDAVVHTLDAVPGILERF